MRNNKILLATIAALGALASPLTQADTATCTGAACAAPGAGPLGVNFRVVIPGIIRFSLGTTGATPEVQWNAGTIGAALVGDGTDVDAGAVTNAALSAAGPGASPTPTGNQLAYRLVSNIGTGSVSIAATAGTATLTETTTPTFTMPWSEILATGSNTGGTGAAITPPAVGNSTGAMAFDGSGLLVRTGTWAYSFENSTLYAAGEYTGTINYTATHAP